MGATLLTQSTARRSEMFHCWYTRKRDWVTDFCIMNPTGAIGCRWAFVVSNAHHPKLG